MQLCGKHLGPQFVNSAEIFRAALDEITIRHCAIGEPVVIEFEELGDDELIEQHFKPADLYTECIGQLRRGHRTVGQRCKDAELQCGTHRQRRYNGLSYSIDWRARRPCGWF